MAQESTFASVFGSPTIGAAAGNIAGAVVGDYMANKQMERQTANQMKLQQQAFRLNQLAIRNQAQNEVIGLRNAGLNPAVADGAGAPVVQSGTASPGNVPTIGNIFDGIAEIIQAVKMPTDIKKTEAETSNLGADTRNKDSQTDLNVQKLVYINPQQMEKVDKDIQLLSESIRNAKNLNDAWEAGDKFLREQSVVIFDRVLAKMQEDGTFEALSPDSQNTLIALANGQLQVGKGAMVALRDAIATQKELSDADRTIVSNAFDNAITSLQWQDKDVMKAIAKAPQDLRNELYQRIKESSERINGIIQDVKTSKTQAELNKALAKWNTFKRESEELNDIKWLAKQGRFSDVDVKTSEDALYGAKDIINGMIRVGEGAITGYAAGKGASAGKTSVGEPTIVRPTDSQMMKVNNSRLLKYLDPVR